MYKNITPFSTDFPHTPQHAMHEAMTSLTHYRWQAFTADVHY